MAFENVNPTSLRNALQSCKNTINHSISDELITSLDNNSVWESDAKKNLSDALETLSHTHYKALEGKIDDYLKATGYIETYQAKERENKNMRSQLNSLYPRLYRTEERSSTWTDMFGYQHTHTWTETVKDYGVESQINSLNNRIYSNKNEMESLKNKVNNLI